MDLGSLILENADLFQQIATLAWFNNPDSDALQKIITARVGYEIWQRLSGQRDVDALRNQTILKISKYVKENPKATKEELQTAIGKYIEEFAQDVDKL